MDRVQNHNKELFIRETFKKDYEDYENFEDEEGEKNKYFSRCNWNNVQLVTG